MLGLPTDAGRADTGVGEEMIAPGRQLRTWMRIEDGGILIGPLRMYITMIEENFGARGPGKKLSHQVGPVSQRGKLGDCPVTGVGTNATMVNRFLRGALAIRSLTKRYDQNLPAGGDSKCDQNSQLASLPLQAESR